MDLDQIFELSQITLESASLYLRQPEFQKDAEEARKQFFGLKDDEELDPTLLKPTDHNNFMLWFLCDYYLSESNTTPLHMFVDREGDKLTDEMKQMAHDMAHSTLAIYDVIAVGEDEETVTLRNLFTMSAIELQDPQIAMLAQNDVFFALRIIPWEDVNFAVGDLYVYPMNLLERFLMFLKSNLVDRTAIVPPSVSEMFKKRGYLFNHMQMMMRKNPPVRKRENDEDVEEEAEETPQPVKQKQTERVVTMARAHFLVEDFDKVKNILDSSNLTTIRTDGNGKTEYTWSKTPARKAAGQEDGTIQLGKSKVIFITNSPDTLEDGKNGITKMVKPYAKYMYDDVEKRSVLG
ncbi:MAG: hypothetical protein LWY06_14815 [Firmicutes bacterium]|nr:hypothetical protein [Bacillota bacterium]